MFTDEQLFSLIIGDNFSIGKKMRCPFRPDRSPSFVIYEKDDKLFWKDFADDGKYDRRPIGLAVKMWNCSYKEAERRIRYSEIPAVLVEREPEHTKGIVISDRYFVPEIEFWDKHCVDTRVLKHLHIYSLRGFYVDDELSFKSEPYSVAYAYVFGPNSWQLYRPTEYKTKKFRSHNINGLLFGYNSLQTGGDLYITSSYKDVAVLTSLGCQAVCPSSESVLTPILAHWGELRLRFDNIYVLFDNDSTGLKNTLSLQKTLGDVIPLFIPPNCPKDGADIIKQTNSDTLKQLICNLRKPNESTIKKELDFGKLRRLKERHSLL